MSNKNIIINSIVGVLYEENAKRNRALCKKNLFSEQKPFDVFGTMLALKCMDDRDFNEIRSLVIGE